MAEAAAKDPQDTQVHDSYLAFLTAITDWSELPETGYRD